MSVYAARALIGWRTSFGSCHNYCAGLWKWMRTKSLLGFVLKSMYLEKLAGLQLHHGDTLQSAVEANVDLCCKTVCFNQLFDDVNIFSIVFQCFAIFIFRKFTEEDGPPLPHLRSLH